VEMAVTARQVHVAAVAAALADIQAMAGMVEFMLALHLPPGLVAVVAVESVVPLLAVLVKVAVAALACMVRVQMVQRGLLVLWRKVVLGVVMVAWGREV
jgi:hypothetical protein